MAVVIVATVITTYSAIRYDAIPDQPQVLSAVDETNLALKQLLGFTVGYYGSILQVTGNTTYAKDLARSYLRSGLENLADIKPEWGLSFNVTQLNLHIDWFLPTSYSQGQFTITYDLEGLGFHGMTYTSQSELNVQVLPSVGNEARLSVHKEDGEPLTALSKDNFKFYRYLSTEEKWELAVSSSDPVVFANGTYSIVMPTGVNPSGYLVQVEDSRGIITVASSFSRYVSTINWMGGGGAEDYVDISTSDVDSSAGKGSHTNFNAQQAVPDSVFDTLSEVNTGGGASNTTLINGASFEVDWSGFTQGNYWSRSTSQHYDGGRSAYFDGDYRHSGTLTSSSMDCSGATAIYVDFWYMDAGCEDGEFMLQYYDGAHWNDLPNESGDLGKNQSTSGWLHYQQRVTDSQYFVSGFRIRFSMVTGQSSDDAYVDLVTIKKEVSSSNYQLDLEEQWTSVNTTNTKQDLCIKTGTLGTESLKVDVWHDNAWVTVINSLSPNSWNNVSINQYLSSTFTIRFKGSSETSDTSQTSWNIDAVLIRPQSDLGSMLSQQSDSTIVVEWLQNGTMRLLGQNMQLASAEMPIPPIPAKALHFNQTINGVEQEVPFQIEDWASEYRVPLGLTNNVTVFSNRQMVVFLLNRDVSEFTLWWDGSDLAEQTPLSYVNTRFNDNPAGRILNNGRISVQFGANFNPVTTTVLSSGNTSTAYFMRVNGEESSYGAELAYVITNGVVRDVIQQDAEWGGGAGTANDCPNLYANIVLTLPAGTSFYTYQLRLMFTESQRDRTISDLCPVRITSPISTIQTENGTIDNIVSGSGTFSNYAYGSGSWTAHHWSQFTSGSSGAGIMFTDMSNVQLYAFDSIAGSQTGAIRTNTASTPKTIELMPVVLHQISPFRSALDITWKGAIATFDSPSTPIYCLNEGKPAGLWILVEYQPQVTVTAEV